MILMVKFLLLLVWSLGARGHWSREVSARIESQRERVPQGASDRENTAEERIVIVIVSVNVSIAIGTEDIDITGMLTGSIAIVIIIATMVKIGTKGHAGGVHRGHALSLSPLDRIVATGDQSQIVTVLGLHEKATGAAEIGVIAAVGTTADSLFVFSLLV